MDLCDSNRCLALMASKIQIIMGPICHSKTYLYLVRFKKILFSYSCKTLLIYTYIL